MQVAREAEESNVQVGQDLTHAQKQAKKIDNITRDVTI